MKTQVKIKMTVEREVEVTLDYYPASKGYRDKFGCPEEPDTPAEFDVTNSKVVNGYDIELTEDEIKRAEESAIEQMASDRDDSMERAMDAVKDSGWPMDEKV